ncbi:7TM diverse intracellular signaling domain-containing protein [Oceanicoccus sp. KOV_DT_Chl]|uniref:7TM diverse intracellular signaling domain-containing protein n=1 Tax=Oceanicoccus sp. KOV_DT_Chl TaxID=1904639 RepID=UPI000C7E51E2|nr:7TM diverse intracellular signaling domain-containing protein [Oceanicoccus sp. KOV_DT_Chl]
MHYGVDFDLQPGEQLEILMLIESRYFSGLPVVEVVARQHYQQAISNNNLIIIGCLGAMVMLALYNLFIGISIKDRSYLYYAAYLTSSFIAWSGTFNGFAQLFNWYSYTLVIPTFFLTITFNTLYFIHFLELPKHHPWLTKFAYTFVAIGFLLLFCLPFMSPGQYMVLYGIGSSVWIIFGLFVGLLRLSEGYKPARYFVAAFLILFSGTVVSILHLFGFPPLVRDSYLVTVVAQTFDMLLLALALADRITLLRKQKEVALQQSIDVEHRAMATEQQANIKLQAALKISEEENQRKSDFLRMVSHELRTPLHSIVSSVEQWNDSEDEFLKKDLLDYISYGAARLRTQVDNLVLLAETDDENLQLTTVDFEIRPLLDRLAAAVANQVHPEVNFVYLLPADAGGQLPAVVTGDAYFLEHMLRSVLENACQYTELGQIEFSVSWNEVDQALNIDVRDTGCGMTNEQQKEMFNSFVQVSRGLERQSEGLGLGLTLCYRISELLAADFVIDSEPGAGTNVHIRVPLSLDTERVEVPVAEGKPVGTLLVVEDNVINAQVLQRLVSNLGYEVEVVHSGQEALARLADCVYDLILMDVQMPVMDGITATRWIRQRGISTPIIAVTANSDPEVRRHCMEVGMNDFMVKPVRRADLQRVLERQYSDRQSS